MSDPTVALAVDLRHVVARLGHVFRSAAVKDGMTPTRLTTLGILERHGPMRPGDVAVRLNITAASMSRLTEALEEGGWIQRDDDPDDRRACLLSLNDQGRTALDTLRRQGAAQLAALLRDLPQEQVRILTEALPVLTGLTDQLFDRLAGEGSRRG